MPRQSFSARQNSCSALPDPEMAIAPIDIPVRHRSGARVKLAAVTLRDHRGGFRVW